MISPRPSNRLVKWSYDLEPMDTDYRRVVCKDETTTRRRYRQQTTGVGRLVVVRDGRIDGSRHETTLIPWESCHQAFGLSREWKMTKKIHF